MQENINNFYGPGGVGKSQVPPFYGEQHCISLRACPEECLSYKWMFQQQIIKELGKGSGKQWIHLQRGTNVKSRCAYQDVLLWEADLMTREEFELICLGPGIEQVRPSAPPSMPQGVWKKPAATK